MTDVKTYRADYELNSDMTDPPYVTWAPCKDGTWTCGTGDTPEESKSRALTLAAEHDGFLRTEPRDRLRKVLSRAPQGSYLLASDITHAIRAIAEILGVT
jgi:hypothetical protein